MSDQRKDFLIAIVFIFGLCSYTSGQYVISMVAFTSSSLMMLLVRKKLI